MRPLIWFRSDLRTEDNTALSEACKRADDGAVAVFTICPSQWLDKHDWADTKVDFILRSIDSLKDDLAALNIPLRILETPTFAELPDALLGLANAFSCDELHFNREYELNERRRDDEVTSTFENAGRTVHAHTDRVIFEPGSVLTKEDKPYTVFSPFSKTWRQKLGGVGGAQLRETPKKLSSIDVQPSDIPRSVAGFDRDNGRPDLWEASSKHAKQRLEKFVDERIKAYKDRRDTPGVNGTSTLSPYLASGLLSPRQCLLAAQEAARDAGSGDGPHGWITELIWREFYQHIMVAFPRVCMHRSFKPEYDTMQWHDNDEHLDAWKQGRTGFPIIDAAMRQLAQTGWMHNRLRMIVASFFTKNLFLDWRVGERHFMRSLIDGDLASNNGGWQWSASVGTDAQPYFRVFNPISQSQTHDPDGTFIRKFVPELEDLDNKAIHEPHAKASMFNQLDYPEPIVDHKQTRKEAIEAFKDARR